VRLLGIDAGAVRQAQLGRQVANDLHQLGAHAVHVAVASPPRASPRQLAVKLRYLSIERRALCRGLAQPRQHRPRLALEPFRWHAGDDFPPFNRRRVAQIVGRLRAIPRQKGRPERGSLKFRHRCRYNH